VLCPRAIQLICRFFDIQVLQRIYKYGGQPFARDYLAQHHGADFDNAFGKGTGKAIMHATAGRYENTTALCNKAQDATSLTLIAV